MLARTLGLAPILAVFLAGCTTTRPPAGQGVFSFEYDGAPYQIVSIVTDDGDGHNFLLRRDGNRTVLRARDDDQDGRLDVVLHGGIDLEQARTIYAAGIAQARELGRCSERTPQRVYDLVIDDISYSLRTTIIHAAEATNRLMVYDPGFGRQLMFVDTGADGTLDESPEGNSLTPTIQNRYEAVLREGVRSGWIDDIDGRFIVRPRRI